MDIDYSYLASFPYFLTYTDGFFEINEVTIFSLIENIFLENVCEPTSSRRERKNQMHFDSIASYLSQNYNKSITLDSLESKFKINKFNLQKNFKKKVGLSPAEYLTVTRIENSKQLFHTESTLTDIALKSGFYDQSHYTNSFLKFVGVTPGVYKRSVKILQE